MIGISRLYLSTVEPSDSIRYGRRSGSPPPHRPGFTAGRKPVVVWNTGRRCNLRCAHCYSGSADRAYRGELTTAEAGILIDDLAGFGVPVILFSGGEPLMRPDILELIARARSRGIRAVLSTNGTLITPPLAGELKRLGLSYAGISLDGLEETHDRFRGTPGAFRRALDGLEACREAGIKVGLRFTITRRTRGDIPGIFALVRERRIPRVCFYHLVYAGRGSGLAAEDLGREQTRREVDRILDLTRELHDAGHPAEVLTVDNHADGAYLYLRLRREDPDRAERALELLRMNGGNSSGLGIGCVSWDGSVHPDQFWRHHSFGNVRQRPFSEIWTDLSDPLLAGLRDRKARLTGRCTRCRFLDLCGGNLRVRAEAATGDVWGPDPACYLTDREIGLEGAGPSRRGSPRKNQD